MKNKKNIKKKKRNNQSISKKKSTKYKKENNEGIKKISGNQKNKKYNKIIKLSLEDLSKKTLSNSELNKINVNKELETSKNKNIEYKNKDKKIFYNDYELNILPYQKALEIDKRTYIEYYLSLLRKRNIFIFTFFNNKDYNSKMIKICLFFFSFALLFTINALFFNDSTLHEIYEAQGNYDFIYQIPKALYSTIISGIIIEIINYFSLTEKSIVELKKEKSKTKEMEIQLINCLKIKFIFFFLFLFLFLFTFWYYISCFCVVYINTQIHLIKDTLISFGFSMIYPLGISLLFGIFRIIALRTQKKNRECLYKFSKFY